VLLLLSATQAISCRGEPKKLQGFFDLPLAEQEKRFRALPLEEQIDIYAEGLKHEPPRTDFKWDIAEGRRMEAVPAILARLRIEQSDYVKCGLMEVFEVMVAPLGEKFDQDTVAAVDGVVKGMRYEVFRQCGERVLGNMRSTLRPAQAP